MEYGRSYLGPIVSVLKVHCDKTLSWTDRETILSAREDFFRPVHDCWPTAILYMYCIFFPSLFYIIMIFKCELLSKYGALICFHSFKII